MKKTGLQALGGLVYSTDAGRLCPGCEQPVAQCRCAEQAIPEGDGIARVRRETKGRGGKTVTTVTGVLLNADDLKALAKRLKNRCGCGGAVKDGIIEIQGDKADQVCELLVAEGFKVKRSGG
ncbi:translation initiation factor Sui1 [Pseudomonas aestusnigri]|uniref:translation initiation factor Sui1 n=1 Tax=Halopseudomonas TaxID=2901189 RepID=UPI000C4F41DB|nr:translation initiation factor Sui1 [Halopseudomonas aestusnigri]MAD27255.1 stress response translation initiation inhibitor YciH [Pseudomonadales bacterium]MCC4259538.1 translation initiation factor Sui1 [Halopseudomonas aestusnigri]